MISNQVFAPLPGSGAQGEGLAQRGVFASLLSPAAGLAVFSVALLVSYVLIPLWAYASSPEQSRFLQLALLTLVCVGSMWVGFRVSLADAALAGTSRRWSIDPARFNAVVWTLFAVVVVVTFATAPSIPILSALQGAPAEVLNHERGEFLKGRKGVWSSLLYLNTMLANTLVPYSIVLSFVVRSRWRFWLAALFFFYCISFLQKALFLNLLLPLLVYYALRGKLKDRVALAGVVVSLFMLVGAMYFSMESEKTPGPAPESAYLTAEYMPANAVDYFVWRAVAVPVFTATDTLYVHTTKLGGRPLMGATSGFVAALSGVKRINLERMVFRHQFHRWNPTGNSNAVFVVDAFVNFGWAGVVVFGLFVGFVFRWFGLTRDLAFASMWPIFAFILFSASLIGLMLSNGFALLMMLMLTMRMDRS